MKKHVFGTKVGKNALRLAGVGVLAASLSACPSDTTDVPTTVDPNPVHQHTFGEWTEITAATCEKPAVEQRECVDGDAKETRNSGEALGHEWKRDPENELRYDVDPNNSGNIVNYCVRAGCSAEKLDNGTIDYNGNIEAGL